MRLSLFQVALSVSSLSGGLVAASRVSECKCSPSDPCWPSSAEWASLNDTLSGRLMKTVPPASACYKSESNYNATGCKRIVDEWTTSVFHSSSPFSVLDPTWSGDACPPLYPNGTGITGDPHAASKGCGLGNLSPYVVNATSATHVQTALRFAKEKNLRINIKNTGHKPEKSSAYGSLSIWTHNMKEFKFHKSFKACESSEPQMAGTIGAGVQDGELFEMMAKHNAIAVGGTNSDVGVVGWALAGGHGYATGQYGMGADSIIEAELVTPEGDALTVNECQYPDLFWAIRGGGGSTFGVVLTVTVKAHPMPSVGIVNFDVSPRNHTSPKQWWNTVASLHKEMAELQDAGYAGYYTISGPPMLFHNTIFAYNVSSAEEARKLVQPLEKALNRANSTVKTEVSALWTKSWYELIEELGPLADATDVGTKRSVSASRLVTRKAIEDTALFAQTLEKIGPQFTEQKNGVSNPSMSGTMTVGKTPVDSALNPAWRDTVVHLITGQHWDDTLSEDIANETVYDMTYDKGYALRQLAPDSGAYINEANSYEPNWQWSFWGPNYPRLLAIKQKYDPNNLLWCRTCVGSEQLVQQQNGSLCKNL
ncbi:hypothetical protein N8T08_002146 [Aspergillus melleus]|uniref:Uncharacterized protein n=1 Tax=Aspergillus melleus TaxID=138277 RepID=A0ACC3AMW4_9EURO|nr:hypothetical protein N8T08_002146 [Aspergillus melleus]